MLLERTQENQKIKTAWVNFFKNQSPHNKTAILEGMWHVLSSAEQTTVVTDLKIFVSQAYSDATAPVPSSGDDFSHK